jgi:hypothetical protein
VYGIFGVSVHSEHELSVWQADKLFYARRSVKPFISAFSVVPWNHGTMEQWNDGRQRIPTIWRTLNFFVALLRNNALLRLA